MSERIKKLESFIRDVPNFPKPGIMFKDITPLLSDPHAFTLCLDLLAEKFVGQHIDAIVGIESRGFIFGSALAAKMMTSFVPARKPGKLPSAVDTVEYELEYGTDKLQMHKDALKRGARVVVIDDLIATGGTAWAACELVRRQGALPVSAAFVIELGFLNGSQRLTGVPTVSLIKYS